MFIFKLHDETVRSRMYNCSPTSSNISVAYIQESVCSTPMNSAIKGIVRKINIVRKLLCRVNLNLILGT